MDPLVPPQQLTQTSKDHHHLSPNCSLNLLSTLGVPLPMAGGLELDDL